MNELAIPSFNDIRSYFVAIRDIPILSKSEEQELFKDKDSKKTFNKIIFHNLRYAAIMARKYEYTNVPLEDLVQEANIGLLKAYKKFDPKRDVKFISFAVFDIKRCLYEYTISNSNIVRMYKTHADLKIHNNINKYKRDTSSLPLSVIDTMSKELNVKKKDIISVEISKSTDFAEYNHHDIFDCLDKNYDVYIEDPNMDPFNVIACDDEYEQRHSLLNDSMKLLSNRCRDILKRRKIDEDKIPLRVLSEEYGISKERVRQLEANATKAITSYILN